MFRRERSFVSVVTSILLNVQTKVDTRNGHKDFFLGEENTLPSGLSKSTYFFVYYDKGVLYDMSYYKRHIATFMVLNNVYGI